MKKFKKEFLREVLGFNEEEIKLTMECQRLFPELLENEGNGCCVNGRTLHKILGVSKKFTDWIKNNLDNADAEENKDYVCNWINDKGVLFKGNVENTKVTDLTGQRYKLEYKLTLDISKEIAMFAGANPRSNKELKNNSKIIRKYFILMEKAIRGLQEHNFVREPEKKNYNIMKEAIINDYHNKHTYVTKQDESCIMAKECNMINICLLGLCAGEVRAKLGYMDRQTREHLKIEQNKTIDFLQSIVTGLVISGMDFEERAKTIDNICKNKYSHLRMDK